MTRAGATARPSTARGEGASRETLLAAAGELMIETGTHDVSLHAIARKAGVTAPLVKYYFGSKDGLLLALVERDTARALVQLDELMAMPVDPLAKMRIHITGIVRTYARYPYLVGLFDQMLRGPDQRSAAAVKDSFVTPLIEVQRRIHADGVAVGLFRPVDPDMLYFVIVGACQYLFTSRVAFRDLMGGRLTDATVARDLAATAIDVVLNGLRADA